MTSLCGFCWVWAFVFVVVWLGFFLVLSPLRCNGDFELYNPKPGTVTNLGVYFFSASFEYGKT